MADGSIPLVQNTVGERTRLSLQRFVRDAIAAGWDARRAGALGRRFVRDVRRAGLALLTTDDARHYMLEQDPLIFAHRRWIRERAADGRWRYFDRRLGRIAELAEAIAPTTGRVLTELFIDYFRPGAGEVLFRDDGDDEPEKVKPAGDLEELFGALAELIELPGTPDFSKPGQVGKDVVFADDPRKRFLTYIYPNDTVSRAPFGTTLPACPERFLFRLEYYRSAPDCGAVDYAKLVREARVLGASEFTRICRDEIRKCPIPDRPRLLFGQWTCDDGNAKIVLLYELNCRQPGMPGLIPLPGTPGGGGSGSGGSGGGG